MLNYLLTIKIRYQCEDDVDARKEAKRIIKDSTIVYQKCLPQYKLQRLKQGKVPEKVEI
jgi:hypothetical protein